MAFAVALTAIVSSLAAPATATADDISPNIIGGHRATQVYEGMASLQYDVPDRGIKDWHTCGAVLVERGWAVTNAHCVTDPPASTAAGTAFLGDSTTAAIPVAQKQFHLSIGATDRNGGVRARVTQIIPHKEWDWGTTPGPTYDAAMLKLDHQVELQPFEIAIGEPRPGTRIRLLGWGLTAPDGSGTVPQFLQELDTTVLPKDRCAGTPDGLPITALELCTDNPGGTAGICYGDSGGPAIAKIDRRWHLVGTASRLTGDYCGDGPGIYTAESSKELRTWVYDVMYGKVTAPKPPAHGEPELTLPYEPGQAEFDLAG